jgi:hypothetical protein
VSRRGEEISYLGGRDDGLITRLRSTGVDHPENEPAPSLDKLRQLRRVAAHVTQRDVLGPGGLDKG